MLDEQGDPSLFLEPVPMGASTEAEEPPAGPAAPLVEVEGGRRRWLAVLVVVALLVAGVVANRRNAEPADEQPADDPPADADVEGAARLRPVPLPPSLQTIEVLGATTPEATGTTLVLAASTQVVVLDVDSGTVRSAQVAELDVQASYPWGSQVLAVGDGIVVRGQPPRSLVLPRADGVPVTTHDAGSGGGLHPSDVEGRYWVEERRGRPRLEERDAAGRGLSHRTVALLDGVRSIVWDGSGFIQSADGRVLETGFDEGTAGPDGAIERARPTSIGTGTAVAADNDTVAIVRCPDDCALELVERATGAARQVVPPGDAAGFLVDDGATLSPDGRWLLVAVAGGDGEAIGLAVVDVGGGSVRAVEPAPSGEPTAGAFSPDGRWLFLASNVSSVEADVAAIDLASGDRHAVATLSLRSGFGIVAEAFPSVPADLGAAGS